MISPGDRVYLDTNVFVDAVELHPQFAATLDRLFREIELRRITSVTSELALAEVLVKPYADGNATLQDLHERAFNDSQGLEVIPVSRAILLQAARVRASTKLALPDAVYVATAQAGGCSHLLTNDQKLLRLCPLKVLTFEALAAWG